MTEIAENQVGGQPKKRERRTQVFRQLKAAGLEVAKVIVEPDGRQIILLAGEESQAETSPLEDWKRRRVNPAA